MDTKERIKELVEKLNKASYEYYNTGYPIMEDREFDRLLDELQRLEIESGYVLKNSPTINAGSKVAVEQKKIIHEHPMLSLGKIHSVDEIKKFLNGKFSIASVKLDGLTVSATYIDGKLTRLETRGNGEEGTDILIHKNSIKGLPLYINHKGKYVVDGECIVTVDAFESINKNLPEEEKFSNPRNMASGSLNLLDSNISAKRGLKFLVWNVIEDTGSFYNEMEKNLFKAEVLGFNVVQHMGIILRDDETIEKILEQLKALASYAGYPMDGIVFSYNDIAYGKSLGRTGHHFNHSVAFKFSDELYETTLENVEWSTSKSGLINPVAVFSPVDMDGAVTTRATLHNVSYIEDLELGIGDTIEIYRANMVIPKVHDNLTRSNTWELPDKCPDCGGKVEVRNENGSKTLHCLNENCPAKLLGKLVHFVSKNAMNIEKMSEATLQKLVDLKYVGSFKDIYSLSKYRTKLYVIDGFGEKSVDTILSNIEKSRNTTLERFLYSLSIPLIGRSVSKDISKYCHDSIDEFIFVMENTSLEFASIDGIGVAATTSLDTWWTENRDMFYELKEEMNFEKDEKTEVSSVNLSGKTFVITGALNHFSSRDELKTLLENIGAKVSGSVSKNTFALICNDKSSNTGKSKKAKELGIPVWTEGELLDFIKD